MVHYFTLGVVMNLPLRRGTTPLKFIPEYEDWLVEALAHGANDDFWKQNNILDYADLYKDIPVYLVGGWYDSWGGNTAANFAVLSRNLKGPVYLIMGPWIHDGQGAYQHGQVTFGHSAAIPDVLAWHLEWFDHWLKGADNSVIRQAPSPIAFVQSESVAATLYLTCPRSDLTHTSPLPMRFIPRNHAPLSIFVIGELAESEEDRIPFANDFHDVVPIIHSAINDIPEPDRTTIVVRDSAGIHVVERNCLIKIRRFNPHPV
jgi:hypothetical protein